MVYRHEWKHEISACDVLVLRQRLRAVAKPDSHAPGGMSRIRSLYFDTPTDTALREKLDGVCNREKFRIRYYNGNTDFIRLEKKCKRGALGTKISCLVTKQETEALLRGDLAWMLDPDRPLLIELRAAMQSGLAPKVLVDYTREAFIYAPGNVRVTLDYDIRTSLQWEHFLDFHSMTLPVQNDTKLLEVKWDAFLPSVIRDAVQLENRRAAAYSKYAACRVYG